MKKNRNQDWTDVLRERLQDARLPLEDKWGSSAAAPGRAAGPSFADTHRSAWWPWALAGFAALVAAVLLLRPASAPEPDCLVQQPVSTALPDTTAAIVEASTLQNAGQAEPIVLLPQPDRSRLTHGLPNGQQPSQRTRPTGPDSTGKRAQAPADSTLRLPQERITVWRDTMAIADVAPSSPADVSPSSLADVSSSSFADVAPSSPADVAPSSFADVSSSSFADVAPSSFADVIGESPTGEGEISDRVGEDGKHESVRPLSELALADLPDEPAQARRTRAGRVALRIQAGYQGASSLTGGRAWGFLESAELIANSQTKDFFNVPVLLVEQQKGYWMFIDSPPSADPSLPDGSGSGHSTAGQYVFEYVPGVRTTEKVPVAVPKAPVFPISFGVSASLSLSRSWTLSVGLDYAQHDGYQAVALPSESQKHYNTSPGGTGYMAYLETAQSLTLHYLGVPLDVHFYFNPESRWRFYVGAGLHAAKCIAVTGGTPLQDPVLFSGNLMAGTDFRLFPGVRLYLAPAVAAPFNRSAYYNSWDTGLRLSLRAGLSFDIK